MRTSSRDHHNPWYPPGFLQEHFLHLLDHLDALLFVHLLRLLREECVDHGLAERPQFSEPPVTNLSIISSGSPTVAEP